MNPATIPAFLGSAPGPSAQRSARKTLLWAGPPLLCLLLLGACDGQAGSVEQELSDLQTARANVANEVDELRNELGESRERVRELEIKLARAKQGLTEEVVEERKELEEALEQAQSQTAEEVQEARELSQELRQQGPAARDELTRVKQLEAKVDSRTPAVATDDGAPLIE